MRWFALRARASCWLLAALFAASAAPAATVQYVYDDLGRLVAVIDPTGQTTTYTYDAAGNLLSVSSGSSTQISVVAFTPNHGKAGDSVTVFGAAFIPNAAQNAVTFNGTAATVTAATETSLVATVPPGATTGPISVSNANGSATSTASFTIVAAPVITAVNPAAVASGTTRVEISGSNLAFATSVTFTQAGISAQVLPGATDSVLPVSITVATTVPADNYGFSVTDSSGTTSSGAVTLAIALRPSGPTMAAARAVSVFMPAPAQSAPVGSGTAVSPPTSVYMPFDTAGVIPAGSATTPAQPVSVSMP